MNTEHRGYTIKAVPGGYAVTDPNGIGIWDVHSDTATAKKAIDMLIERTDQAIEMARAAMSKPANKEGGEQ